MSCSNCTRLQNDLDYFYEYCDDPEHVKEFIDCHECGSRLSTLGLELVAKGWVKQMLELARKQYES